MGAQFLLSEADPATVVGRNRAEAASGFLERLNPRVRIVADSEPVTTKNASYFQDFDIVIATDLDPGTLEIISTATRLHEHAFYAAGLHGLYAYIFSDLIEHEFVEKRNASNVPATPGEETRTRSVMSVLSSKEDGNKEVELITKRELYSTWLLASDAANLPSNYLASKRHLKGVTPVLSCMRALWGFVQETGHYPQRDVHDDLKLFTALASSKHKALGLPAETLTAAVLRQFTQNIGLEIAAVAAIVGGQLAQDVINVLGRSQPPIQNMVIFDGDAMTSDMYALHPEGSLGRGQLKGALEDAAVLASAGVGPPVSEVLMDGVREVGR
jgi:ubiquitin-like 1-activating enzyme E1 A